jgi:peptidoglycan LD-endopeptidase LytH
MEKEMNFRHTGNPFMISVMRNREYFVPVMPFKAGVTRCVSMDLSGLRADFTAEVYEHLDRFCAYINDTLETSGADYGIGGYAEDREMYARSRVFDAMDEPRRLHLGIDIWTGSGTPVFAPLPGIVHSVGVNDAIGDYGGTLILSHVLDGQPFHTLYGHLSHGVSSWKPGDRVMAGIQIAELGAPSENGSWPPHLHFQCIRDMEGMTGDYPGVCRRSDRLHYLTNCPDPMPLLGFNPFNS